MCGRDQIPNFHISTISFYRWLSSLSRWLRKLQSGKYKQENTGLMSTFIVLVNARGFRIYFRTKFCLLGLSQSCRNFSASCKPSPNCTQVHEAMRKETLKGMGYVSVTRRSWNCRIFGLLGDSSIVIAIAALQQENNAVQRQGKASEVTVLKLSHCGLLLKPSSTKRLSLILITANYTLRM